jgi:3-isopropylmalate dehydratase
MPTAEGGPRTLYDKVFQDHIVDERLDGTILLYIGMHTLVPLRHSCLLYTDRHLVHEVTSPVSSFCCFVSNAD